MMWCGVSEGECVCVSTPAMQRELAGAKNAESSDRLQNVEKERERESLARPADM